MYWSLVTYLHHHGLTCWFRFSFHKNLMKTELQIELVTSMLSFFIQGRTHVITQPQHSYTLVMKSLLALTLCVLCLVSLRGHYPNSSLRPLPRSQNFFWVTFCSTGCRTLFCHLSLDWRRKGFLLLILVPPSLLSSWSYTSIGKQC